MSFAFDFALYLWIINLIEMLLISYIFIREYKQGKMKFYFGVALFYMVFVFARLFEVIRIYVLHGDYNPPLTGLNFVLKTGYTLFSYIGLTVIYFVLESYVFTKTKKIFTILVPIACILSIWFTSLLISDPMYNILFTIVLPIYIIILFAIVGMYIYLAIKSSGEVRRNSIMIIFGILLFEFGIMFALPEARSIFEPLISLDILLLVAPLVSILGVILQIRGFKTSIS